MDPETVARPGEQPEPTPVLRCVREMLGDTVSGVDGDLGKVDDILFDEHKGVIRYFVVETGHWLSGRRVLISPKALRQPEWGRPRLWVSLTKQEIASSPTLDTEKPVSRSDEIAYNEHYGYDHYWEGMGLWGAWPMPREPEPSSPDEGAVYLGKEPVPEEREPGLAEPPPGQERPPQTAPADLSGHLFSLRKALGYHLLARDGEIGHVENLVVDGMTWQVRYLLITPSHWHFGKKLLLPVRQVRGLDRRERLVYVELTREEIRNAPEWDHIQPIRPEYEAELTEYYRHTAVPA